ncbi:MAG: type IX secretion system membrane protein PorP/SprF [Flavobacteriales bacterium]|nr:type IX secretion system membrane protein PorP/SprF [Flavobacteriales bacterium]MBK7482625.1 type IX secretion system membrane protein PorP/SprF [Flavobacteriales bacterium]
MRSMRSITLFVVLAGFALRSTAQQDPLYSQYMFNTLAFNPAYAGSADVFTVMALSRHQWVGFEGAPATQTILAHSPLKAQNLALGFSAINDKIGPSHQTAAYADCAYRIRTSEDTRLSFGLKGGLSIYQADLASLSTVEVDPSNVNTAGQLLPNFGFGLYWHSPRYYLGASAPKLLKNELNIASGTVLMPATEARHYFLMGGYVLDLSRDIKFKPAFMFRVVEGAPFSLDVNANFLLRERIWFGAMYRLGNAFGVMGQYQINDQFRVGYAFDLTTTRIGAYNAGTHEVMLSYDFRFLKGKTISPRYF